MRLRLPHFLTGHLTLSLALIFSFLLFSSPARAQSVSFVAGHDFQASQADTAVILIASGDFNNDGKIDLLTVTTAQNDYSISILLGNGDGTFQAPSTITTAPPAGITAIAVGDFNGDGKPDFAVLNQSTNSVVVYLGNGDGTFQAPKTTTIANPPQLTGALVVADFNKDGKADVAVTASAAQSGTGSILVLIGKGDGTFQSPVTYAVAPASNLLATGDVNGDKNIDLITGGVSVLLGNGDGTFQAAKNTPITGGSLCSGTSSLGVGDFTGSGVDSVALSNQILLSNGDGTFATPVCNKYLDGTSYFAVGDFNDDGKADLAAVNQQSASIFLSTGAGALQQSQTFPRAGSVGTSSQYVVADLNGDGNIDLVAPAAANNVTVFLGTGAGTFLAPSTVDTGANNGIGYGLLSLLPTDLNGDGKTDLLSFGFDQNSGEGVVFAQLGNGNGTFQTSTINEASEMAFAGAVGDFDDDGKPDVVTIGYSNEVSVLLGNGDGTLQAESIYTATFAFATAIGVADFNNDGKQDLIVSGWAGNPPGSAGAIDLFLGNGDGTFGFATNVATIANQPVTVAMVVGDFNGDGKPDLAVAGVDSNGTDGDVWIYLNNGTGSFQTPIDIGIVGPPASLVAADFNGDGKLDFAVSTGSPANNVQVWLGDGTGNFSLKSTLATGPGTGPSLVAADFNGDGIPDLAIPNDGISVFTGNGDGTFTFATKLDGGSPIAAADFNGDGKIDLAWLEGNSVALLFNGASTFSLSVMGPSSATVNAGQSATYHLQLVSNSGFTGTLNFSCTGAPTGATCKVSPSTSNVLVAGSTALTVTVTTTGSSLVTPQPDSPPSSLPPSRRFYSPLALILICLLTFALLARPKPGQRLVNVSSASLALLLIFTCLSCGGGGGSSGSGGSGGTGGSGGGSSATPAGTYTLKVIATAPTTSPNKSSSPSASVSLTLIVN